MIFHGYFVPQCSSRHPIACLTHWGRGTYIYISGSDHGLSPGQRQAIFWTNEWISLIGPVGTNLSGIFIEIKTFSLTNLYLKVLSAKQGWGQFHFFNSIPIPIPLFSIPIPIPLLTKSFNSNSNSRDFNANSNSNSGDFKSRQYQFWKWPLMSSLKLIIIILTRYMYIRLLLSIPSVSYPLLNGYDYMASWWLMLYQ